MTTANLDNINIPPFEVVENGEDTRIRISVPGLSAKDIRVWTAGTLLFVETEISDSDIVEDKFSRVGGDVLTPDFKMEFTIDTSVTVGGPYIYKGVLNIPIRTKPEVVANIREYTVREMSKGEAEVIKGGDDNSIFKDSYK